MFGFISENSSPPIHLEILGQLAHCTKVRLCCEGVTKLFPNGFDRKNSIFLHPHGKRKLATELHLSAINFESSRAIFLYFFQEKP